MRPRPLPLLAAACLAGLGLACFGPVLFRDHQFGYRDAAHFYYPLYLRVQQQWEAGHWPPLWEPEENAGMPLLGNPTAAVLYPGKVLYALLPYPWATRLYTIAHVAIAVAAMFLLLRHWGISRVGSTLGATGYGFGAPVLYQYCNIIFLVGASWAPLGLRAVDRWVRLGDRRAIPGLAAVLALTTLGGDPQVAYVLGLYAGGLTLGLAWSRGQLRLIPMPRWLAATAVLGLWLALEHRIRPDLRNDGLALAWLLAALVLLAPRKGKSRPRLPWLRTLGGLLLAAFLGFALTGAQLLPTLEFLRQTVRAAQQGAHAIFPFSLEPYRLAELAFPNVYGSPLSNRHWLAALPPRHAMKIWVSSLYAGSLVLILALAALRFRKAPSWHVGLGVMLVASTLLSLGQFASPLWLARNIPQLAEVLGPHDPTDLGELRRDGFPADGTYSPYWFLAYLLPGFAQFRYPSKFLTWTNLALAALAGVGWDTLATTSGRRRALRIALALAALGLLGFALSLAFEDRLRTFWTSRDPGALVNSFGAFDPTAALRETRASLALGALAHLASAAVALIAYRRRPRLGSALALIVLSVDLAASNASLIVTVPQSVFEERPLALTIIEQAERDAGSPPGPFRVHRVPSWEPAYWHIAASPNRLRELVEWERRTLQPKYGIPYGLQYTATIGTSELYDYEFFFAPFFGSRNEAIEKQLGLRPGDRLVYYPRRGYDLWNTRYFLLPKVPANIEHRGIISFLPDTEPIYPRPEMFEGPEGPRRLAEWNEREDWMLLRNKKAYPRAWVVHEVRRHRPIRGLAREDREAIMEEILHQGDELWRKEGNPIYDPHTLAWVETEDAETLRPYPSGGPPLGTETVEVTRHEPNRVELKVHLERPGLVVLCDAYYPGWKLTIDGVPSPIHRVNRMMRGAAVESGDHALVYTYQPDSFARGLLLSAAGLLAWLTALAWSLRWPFPTTPAPPPTGD